MAKESINQTDWVAVTARAQAYLALHQAGLGDRSVSEKAKFLMNLGLSRADAAALLGSSDDSLRHLLASATKKDAAAAVAKQATSGKTAAA